MKAPSRPRFAYAPLALALAAAFSTAHAQEAAPAAAAELDSIVVTGTHRPNLRSIESSAPVDVITPAQLKSTGAVTLNEALEKLHPSFNFPQGQNSWNGQNTRSAELRGVSPAYTLVLVNGKRRHTSSQITNTLPYPPSVAVDINVIPVSSVARVEILRDGAAAQYGSDAIAGVVNIVLKEEADKGEVTASVGGYTDGGGFTRSLNGWKGLGLGEDGFLTLSFDYFKSDFVDRADPDWRPLFPAGDPRNDSFDKKWAKWGTNSRDSWSVLANAGVNIDADTRAYGYINYADRNSGSYVNPERVIATTIDPITLQTLTTTPSTRAVTAIYPNGYDPQSKSDAQDLALVAGVTHGDDASGKFDLSLSYGHNEAGKWTLGTVNPSWGAASPTDFYWGSTKFDQLTAQADYVKQLAFASLARPAILSSGLIYRHEKWSTGDLADPAAYTNGGLANATNRIPIVAASVDSPIRPEDASSFSRDVGGGYVGLESDITERLQLGVTGRYENYSDFGDTVNGELTGRFQITPALALRGTASTGFHAPSLAQLGTQVTGYTSTWSNTGATLGTPGQTRLFRPNDPLAANFGAKPLDPEKSQTFSLGFVLLPTDNSSITVDAYYLKIKDAVVSTDTLTAPVVATIFNNIGLPGFTQASYYFNGWDSTTKGVDVIGKTRFDRVLGGRLDLSAGVSFIDTSLSNVKSTINVGGTDINVINPYRVRDAETGTPKNKLIFDARWSSGPWIIDAFVKRYGTYWYNAAASGLAPGGNGNRDQKFGPEWYLDLDVSYQLTQAWRLFGGAKNLLNEYPDKYVLGNRANGVNTYSFIAPNGAAGRFVYAGASYAF